MVEDDEYDTFLLLMRNLDEEYRTYIREEKDKSRVRNRKNGR
jgi:hypothetical protein